METDAPDQGKRIHALEARLRQREARIRELEVELALLRSKSSPGDDLDDLLQEIRLVTESGGHD